MSEIGNAGRGDYTSNAHEAILQAVRDEDDFGGWLAAVSRECVGRLGPTFALKAGRPGSWEADLVQQLVKGTIGYDDDYLANYRKSLP